MGDQTHAIIGRKEKGLTLIILLFAVLLVCWCAACSSKGFDDRRKTAILPTAIPPNPSVQKAVPLKNNGMAGLNSTDSKVSFTFAVFGDSKILPEQENWQGNRVLKNALTRINKDNPALAIYIGDGLANYIRTKGRNT